MINIDKNLNLEPNGLKSYRNEIKRANGYILKGDYEKFCNNCQDGKKELQNYLLSEQSNLCCYCMIEINQSNMRIEHFKPRESCGSESLTYSNLLASCEGTTGKQSHCDKSKECKKLIVLPNPADKKFVFSHFIDYKLNGEIFLQSAFSENLKQTQILDYMKDINTTLNLNNEELVKARIAKWAAIIDAYTTRKPKNPKTT